MEKALTGPGLWYSYHIALREFDIASDCSNKPPPYFRQSFQCCCGLGLLKSVAMRCSDMAPIRLLPEMGLCRMSHDQGLLTNPYHNDRLSDKRCLMKCR